MKKLNLKILVGIITFFIGIFAVGGFTYCVINTENKNLEITKTIETEKSNQPQISEEEKVYLAILNELFIKDGQNSLAISDTTNFYSNAKYLKETTAEERIQNMQKYYDSASLETLENYEMKMHKSSEINFDFQLPVKYSFINKEEFDRDFENNIKDFSKKYPNGGGLIEFSSIGFNVEKTQAFVSVDFTYCGLCGFGSHLLLEKIEGNWKIVKNYGGWVS